ncbi:MAG: YdiU family protein [Gammaproteobacteria bacterium]|nr:YdiU family protein [Gammaproteobacteria bacterium]MBU1646619.1 YdiU family protein [Gammaproteobacteria bacterium]MBU1972876.1 YdiU family protein [Gammaproteobacteria bacterium]
MLNFAFDNRFVNELPGDPDIGPQRRQVHGACWSAVAPTPVATPRLLASSPEVAHLLDIAPEDIASPDFAEVFGGNRLLPGMQSYAACYGGYQFGNWAGQLGDGRAINLGEVINGAGQRWELQLKGAGPTPYARRADGRAVLRSSIREFLCSEAMHHLGVPTTRALSLVGTGESVLRDMFYDGNPRHEPGAVVCRVAPSFIRFGNFEILASRNDEALLARLADFTIARDFPEIEGDTEAKRSRWFIEVCERSARMVAHWMRVGFVHGVMNTDNMSILGLTIDYGPYGWIDNYDPEWTPNTTDAGGRRYRFGHQPQIVHWNLTRLAEALVPLFPSRDALLAGLERYAEAYSSEYGAMLAAKFGLAGLTDGDDDLVAEAFALMQEAEVDMTAFFRGLAEVDLTAPAIAPLCPAFYRADLLERHAPALDSWLARYAACAARDGMASTARREGMNAVNPRFVLRNYLAQQAIDRAEQGDASEVNELLDVMRRPYAEQPGRERFAALRPDWARHKAGCSMLSCSS